MKTIWRKIKTELILRLKLKPRFLILGLVLLGVALISGFTVHFFTKTGETKKVLGQQNDQNQSQAPLEVSNDEAQTLYDIVNKIILLPDEKPKISTVNGVDKLKQEPFFRNARNGDKVLVFEENKKAILYNPTEHRIIEVGQAQLKTSETSPATPSADVTESTEEAVLTQPIIKEEILN